MTYLLIVESPAKAKTINEFLGSNYKVLASMGHIRSLPKKNDAIDIKNNFELKYEILTKSNKTIKELIEFAKKSDKIILASDPDREGEAIAWHIFEILKQKKIINDDTKIERVVFNAITKNTVNEAIKNSRKIDMNLVNAQQARVALDYLVGFNLSPVLWRKLPGSKSAGRVQSVALRLICDRENEIEKFKKEEFWNIILNLLTDKNEKIQANLTHINDKKLDKFSIKNEKEAREIEKLLKNKEYIISKIERKETKKNPYPPFTTSTLQQEANKKLNFSAKKTMSIAQSLYEGKSIGKNSHGLITYMRTDGIYTAPEIIEKTRNFIKKQYGEKYLPNKAIIYQNKIKNAQEAHEAIRPTDPTITPTSIKKYLTDDEYKLYDLIWKRLISSQMSSVIFDQVSFTIKTIPSYADLKATGSLIKFDGFYILYNIDKEKDEEKEETDDERILPNVKENEKLKLKEINIIQHWTEPPARYSEASLVKKMEELGIGRPSTYATILNVIQERKYVRLDKKKFIPEERGRIVISFLKNYFLKYVEYDYTAKLEDDLDEISNGRQDWKNFLNLFWVPFNTQIEETLKIKNTDVIEKLTENLQDHIFGYDDNGNLKNNCPKCNGKLTLKMGKFGSFIGCSNYPTCKYIKNINSDSKDVEDIKEIQKFENKLLGEFDKKNIYLKKGPYGFYIQLGEDNKKEKPKRIGISKIVSNPEDISFEEAKTILDLPKLLGKDKNGDKIEVNIGRFGPYISYNNNFYSIKNSSILDITLNDAMKIIEENPKKETKKSIKKKKILRKV